MRRQMWLALGAALVAFFLLHLVRGYPPSLASLLGAAIGALVWAVMRTADRLQSIYRSDRDRGPY